jgi:hypothetical protein
MTCSNVGVVLHAHGLNPLQNMHQASELHLAYVILGHVPFTSAAWTSELTAKGYYFDFLLGSKTKPFSFITSFSQHNLYINLGIFIQFLAYFPYLEEKNRVGL